MGVVYALDLTFADGQTSRRVFEVGGTVEVGEGRGAVDVESIPIYIRRPDNGGSLLVVVRVRGYEIPRMTVRELDPAELARPPRHREPDKRRAADLGARILRTLDGCAS